MKEVIVTKQEEIREFITKDIIETIFGDTFGYHSGMSEIATEKIFTYLHSQGVVIKVERELPDNPYYLVQAMAGDSIYNEAQQGMLRAGYTAFEPLKK